MRHHRYSYGCFGWPKAYAYGWSTTTPQTQCNPTDLYHESRRHYGEHKGRRRRSGEFGARRPLRYLSYNLDLDESQRRQIATLLDQLKMDREQADLDEKKTVSELASLIGKTGVAVDDLKVALSPRVRSTENLQITIAKVLHQIVEVLDEDQREEFAYLLRSGAFRI